MTQVTIDKKIKDVITKANWFKLNYPKLVPGIGEYSPIGTTYPSIAYNVTFGSSEVMIPACRCTLTFVIYADDTNNSYGVIRRIVSEINKLINRKPQNLCDIQNGLRVVGCVKTGGEIFFNKEISKRGADLIYELVLDESEEESSSSDSGSNSSSDSDSSSYS